MKFSDLTIQRGYGHGAAMAKSIGDVGGLPVTLALQLSLEFDFRVGDGECLCPIRSYACVRDIRSALAAAGMCDRFALDSYARVWKRNARCFRPVFLSGGKIIHSDWDGDMRCDKSRDRRLYRGDLRL